MEDQGFFSRGVGIIPPHIHDSPIMVIGLGGIGSWVMSALTRCGFRRLAGVDPDSVGAENVGSQMYAPSQVGEAKVEAIKRWMLPIDGYEGRVMRVGAGSALRVGQDAPMVVAACVDSMTARSAVYEAARRAGAQYLVDGRMGGQAAQVYWCCTDDTGSVARYERTLHPDSEGERLPCTMRATAFCGSLIGGLMAHRVSALLAGRAPAEMIEVDLERDECLALDPRRHEL